MYDIERSVAEDENPSDGGRSDQLGTSPDSRADQRRPVLGVGPVSSESEVSRQPGRGQFYPCSLLQVAGYQTDGKVPFRDETVEQLHHTRKNTDRPVGSRLFHFLFEVVQVGGEQLRARILVPPVTLAEMLQQLPRDQRISHAVRVYYLTLDPDPEDLPHSPIKGTHAGSAGQNQSSVNIEERQPDQNIVQWGTCGADNESCSTIVCTKSAEFWAAIGKNRLDS